MSDREGLLRQLLEALEAVTRDLEQDSNLYSDMDLPAIVAAIAGHYFETCAEQENLLPKFVLSRVLMGTGDDSMEYLPTSPLIPPSRLAAGSDSLTDMAALATYIQLSERLRNERRGGGITRRLFGEARPPRRLLMLPVSETTKFSSIQYDEHLITVPQNYVDAFRPIFLSVLESIVRADQAITPKNFHAFEKYLPIRHNTLPLPEGSDDDLSYGLVRTWFDVAKLQCYWLCGLPYDDSRGLWGGIYFLSREPPTEGEVLITGILTREIFLRAHHIERAREAERRKIDQEQTRKLEKSHQMLHLLQDPLKKVMEMFSAANSNIQTLNAILNEPVRGIFAAHRSIAELFDDGTEIRTPDGTSVRVEHQASQYKDTDTIRWILAHLLARVGGHPNLEGNGAQEALRKQVYFYEQQLNDPRTAYHELAQELNSLLGLDGRFSALLEYNVEEMRNVLDRAKKHLFNIFKPTDSHKPVTLDVVKALLPKLGLPRTEGDLIDILLSALNSNPFATQSHLLEFLAAIVHQAAPFGEGVTLALEASSESHCKFRLSASGRSFVENPESVARYLSDPRELDKYADVNFGNFLGPLVDILRRSPKNYLEAMSCVQSNMIVLAWGRQTSLKEPSANHNGPNPCLVITIEERQVTVESWSSA